MRFIFAILFGICSFSMTVSASDNAAVQQSAGDESVMDALNLIRSGDFETGILAMRGLAESGNPKAMFHMGEIYRLGIGKKDSEEESKENIHVATMYYRLASKLGHDRASLSLANILFFDGDGSEKTYAEALEAWQNMALKGSLEAIYMLGMVYWNGEAGVPRDPIRGYGLIWLAADKGYKDAEQNELSMKALLNTEAKEVAVDYAQNYRDRGFGTEPLSVDLVLASTPEQVSTPIPEKEEALVKPEDWTSVWRLEVGFAMSELEVRRLQSVITSTQSRVVGNLFSEVVDSANRPGLYRLVFGPVKSMHDAVSRCVDLKRAGHDCFARPPEDD